MPQTQKNLHQNTTNKNPDQEEKVKSNINNSNIIEQMQNKNNFNLPPPYINLFAQNNPNSNYLHKIIQIQICKLILKF